MQEGSLQGSNGTPSSKPRPRPKKAAADKQVAYNACNPSISLSALTFLMNALSRHQHSTHWLQQALTQYVPARRHLAQ